MIKAEWAYELDNAELLKRLMEMTAKVGVSSSGLVFDLGGGGDRAEMDYLRAVILSKLDKQEPPFKPGESVELSGVFPLQSVNRIDYRPRFLKIGEVHEVVRVYYEGKNTWSLLLRDDEQFRYFAAAFTKVDKKPNAEPKRYAEPHYTGDLGYVDAEAE